ncbi:thioester domain-containing protein [Agromyces sp. NPDC056965]|uniref:thioester domain-containing protein n=1 Tax=Agromyces sp. NPDC056965 TaxID=3345983 RepID=UPI00363C4EBF
MRVERIRTIAIGAVCAVLLGTIGALGLAAPATAVPVPDDPPVGVGDSLGGQVTVDSFPLIGSAVGAQDATLDPLAGYPSFPVGLTPASQTTAQIQLKDSFGTATGVAYCIDLETETRIGTNYDAGEWSETTIPNLSQVAYILTHYFPNTAEPAGLATPAEKTAAVQAAIWFFTDKFILADASPLRGATSAIVADAIANASDAPPVIPELTVTPPTGSLPSTGDLVGPFVVSGNVASGVLEQRGVQVYRDAAGTQPVANLESVDVGSSLWVQYVSDVIPMGFRLTAAVEYSRGSVYVYNGTNPGVTAAQTLILATNTVLPVRAGVPFTWFEAGQLEVTKRISGTGAGLQGDVTIEVVCTGEAGDFSRSLTVPAGTAAGDHPLLVSGIPVGSECTVTEPGNGATALASLVTSSITPASVTITSEAVGEVLVSNEYAKVPTPTPAPTPTTGLAASGTDSGLQGGLALALLGGGVLLGLIAAKRRRVS